MWWNACLSNIYEKMDEYVNVTIPGNIAHNSVRHKLHDRLTGHKTTSMTDFLLGLVTKNNR